jgi:phosphoribosyl 1,2-cyclic phosphodiesterase
MSGGVTVTFWGVRGSTPCDGARYARYGGNTSCVSLEADGHRPLIFDLGTGLREYGEAVTARAAAELEANRSHQYLATALLTHLHWDHIIGLPFFTPAFRPDAELDVHGPQQPGGLGPVFADVMRPPYFPITPADMGGRVTFYDTASDDFGVNGAKVRSRWVRHTDPTLGYRVELEGAAVTYISDHGQGCSSRPAHDDHVPEGVLELCDDVDVLIHDSQHTAPEFAVKRHFGHCTVDYAVRVAKEAGARMLVLFHHCPTHTDDDIDRMLDYARDLAAKGGGPEVIAAREGMRLPVASH